MFDRVLHVESKHRTCASLCFMSNIDIFKYVTQLSTCAQDKAKSRKYRGILEEHSDILHHSRTFIHMCRHIYVSSVRVSVR